MRLFPATTCLLLLLPLGAAATQPRATLRLPPASTVQLATTTRQPARLENLSPSLRDWVRVRARATLERGGEPDTAVIARDARLRLSGQDFVEGDIESLVILVMMEASRQAEQDLRDITEQMHERNEAKARQREMMRQQQAARQDLATQARADYARAVAPASPATVAPAATDSLGEMGQMDQMRMQMAMDRRSKMMATVSNLLKKQSDTAATITSNLK